MESAKSGWGDRATAHASYFVAFIFGLFTVLGVVATGKVDNLGRVLLFVLSWIIWVSGLYCLVSFGFYSYLADRTRRVIIGDLTLPFEEIKDPITKLPYSLAKLSIKTIDDGILKDLVVTWRWNLRACAQTASNPQLLYRLPCHNISRGLMKNEI